MKRQRVSTGIRRAGCIMLSGVMLSGTAGCQKIEADPAVRCSETPLVSESRPEAEMSAWSDKEAEEPEAANYSADDFEKWNQLLDDCEISEDFQDGLEQFAFTSVSAVLKEEEGNANYSPLSLYYAMALAGCGAEGETAAQICRKLGVSDRKELAEQCRRLYDWYAYRQERDMAEYARYGAGTFDSRIRLANSLWISRDLDLKEEYQKLAAEQFYASSYGVNFSDSDTGVRIGEWIAEHTEGVLKPEFSIDPSTMLAIVNTLYFYGSWTSPFSETATAEDTFTMEDERTVSCPFLNRTESMGRFKKGDGCTVSYLTTSNHCSMVFLLPDQGRRVEEFLETPEQLMSAMKVSEEGWTTGEVTWKIPKFSFGSSYKLRPLLESMGLERMFGKDAEFGGISGQHLEVSDVIQETHIGLDENGVEGAAYTMMMLAAGAMITPGQSADMILDRPFLFGIRDDSHDAWLFLGVCRAPS